MQFIDEVRLHAKAGDGGNGIVAWRREAHVPKGGPAGGDGGDGGDVLLIADDGVHSLLDFTYSPRLWAKNGQPGRGKNQAGEKGADVSAKVPIGTQVFDDDSGELLADLTVHGEVAVLCRGGSGGFGNTRFATPSRQAPEFAKPGLAGEEKNLRLELKLMADVGMLGFPNAGKSTFLSRVSAAKPKIASYPFTTLVPQLGVVKSDEDTFVLADIPGLIEGASEGRGLGIQFLKHLERVRVLCHLVAIDPNVEGDDVLVDGYRVLRNELAQFSQELATLPEIVAVNKIDLVEDATTLPQVKKLAAHLKKSGAELAFISGVSGAGIVELTRALKDRVNVARGPRTVHKFSPFARAR